MATISEKNGHQGISQDHDQGQGQGLSLISLEDLEPLPPPRISRFPAPFDFPEKPVPQVPDVSLIFDTNNKENLPLLPQNSTKSFNSSTLSSFQTAQGSTDSNSATPEPKGKHADSFRHEATDESSKNPLSPGNKEGEGQDIDPSHEFTCRLTRLEEKLDQVLAFQASFLSEVFRRSSLTSASTQTDPPLLHGNETSVRPQHSHSANHFRPPSSTPAPGKGGTKKNSPASLDGNSYFDPSASALPLPQSAIFSEASVKSLGALGDFEDDCDENEEDSSHFSSPKEREVHPTGTFYKKVLGAVNKVLDSDKENDSPKNNDKRVMIRYQEKDKYSSSSSSGGFSSNSSGGWGQASSEKGKGDNHGQGILQLPQGLPKEDEVVYRTKAYLESLGINFGVSPPRNPPAGHGHGHAQSNWMIQQNVFHSIYIPTVTCAATGAVKEALHEGPSSTLINKYIPKGERGTGTGSDGNQGPNSNGAPNPPGTETVYGLSPSNLSLGTREYLQRYGLAPPPPQPSNNRKDRILDVTQIKKRR